MDDLISRAALLNRVPKCDIEMHVMDIKRLINRQTAVDAEPVRCGEWINSGDYINILPLALSFEPGIRMYEVAPLEPTLPLDFPNAAFTAFPAALPTPPWRL